MLRLGLAGGGALILHACGDDSSSADGSIAGGDGGPDGPPGSDGPGDGPLGADGGADAAPGSRPLLPRIPTLAPTSSDGSMDFYDIHMMAGTAQVRPGPATPIWGFNGTWPGHTVRARSGKLVVLRQHNDLPENMSIHLHGAFVAATSDGHPTDYVAPGTFKDYSYPNNQIATTLWFHDHVMDLTGIHVYKGLAAFYLIGDAFEDGLGLPSGDREIPLLIQDRSFNANNSLSVTGFDPIALDPGFHGNEICVNGVIAPRLDVGRYKIRFRMVNGSNARRYRLELSNGAGLIVIGTDGGLLPAPVTVTAIEMAPAERFDFIIDFSSYAMGTSFYLRDAAFGGRDVLRFDVNQPGADTPAIPLTLRPIVPFNEGDAVRTRTFTFAKTGDNWTMNGLEYDPGRIDASPNLGDIEIWELVNNSLFAHPFHIHLIQTQVLDIAGAAPPPELAGWKDTLLVKASQTVRIIGRFEGFAGTYVFHCHNLEHEDHRMMLQFQTVP